MKRILIMTWIALFGLSASQAQQVEIWNNPAVEQGKFGDGFFNVALDVTKVELKEQETVVYLTVRLRSDYPDYNFTFEPQTHLRAGGQEYKLLKADGIVPGEYVQTGPNPECRRDLVFHFEPLPHGTRKFDFIESESSSYKILGIQPVEELWNRLFPSYWRDEQTGDWVIGFFEDCAVYQCKFWTYDKCEVNARNGKAKLVLRNGDETLAVRVDKNKKGYRLIQIGREKKNYAMLTERFMPAYPVKDERTTFVDSGYKPDTITVVGWLKGMPPKYREMKTFGFSHYEDPFADDERIDADLDEQGRFTMKIPVLNTCECLGDWKRCFVRFPLEPGKTYFMLFDFKEGRRYFMGDDVRLQNELFKFPIDWNRLQFNRGDDYARFVPAADRLLKAQYAYIDSLCVANPSLSTRFKIYRKENTLWQQAREFAQGRFYTEKRGLTDEARRYAHDTYWTQLSGSLSRHRDTEQFIIDFLGDVAENTPSMQQKHDLRDILEEIDFDEQSAALITRYTESADTLVSQLDGIDNEEERERIVNDFNTRHADLFKELQKILNGPKVKKFLEKQSLIGKLNSDKLLLDSLNAPLIVREMIHYKVLDDHMEWSYCSLPPGVIDTFKTLVKNPVAIERIERSNAHYAAIENREFDKFILKSSDNLKDLTEGEALLKKILEPYKGTIVLLDVWGTWCGPCKEALSHSTEEYARLSKYNVTYLYLANNSPQESWENVIKEHNVTGPNVAHYNLPAQQQQAIERYLKVQSFPTYKLFDRDGNLLDVKVNARDLDALEELIKKLSEK